MLDEKHLIPLKVKAWCEFTTHRKAREEDRSLDIHKHHGDVHKLLTLLPVNMYITLPNQLKTDM